MHVMTYSRSKTERQQCTHTHTAQIGNCDNEWVSFGVTAEGLRVHVHVSVSLSHSAVCL